MFSLNFPSWATMFNSDFTPHAFCLSWDPVLLAMTIFGNLLVAYSYLAIPVQLIYMRHKIKNSEPRFFITKNPNILGLYALFILMCGISHQMDIITLWFPYYWIQGVIICITGIVSLIGSLAIPYLLVNASKESS